MQRAILILPFLLVTVAGAPAHFLEDPHFKNLCAPFYSPERGLQFDRAAADDLAHLNVSMVRMEFIGGLDRQRTIDYDAFDVIVDEAGKRGIAILGLLAYQIFDVDYQDKATWSEPAFRQRYIGRVEEIVTRYHDREFPIRHWEIWHQPDTAREHFDVRVEPEPFALMLIEAYETIKSIDSGAFVVFGGISPGGHQYEENYLRDVYESAPMIAWRAANGRSPFDAVAVHPHEEAYDTINPGLSMMLTERIKSVMNEFGDQDMKIWITALGWNSRHTGLPKQARLLNQSYHTLETLTDPANPHSGPFIERYFWYQYQNHADGEDWGLRTQDRMTRKASYFAFRDLTPAGPAPGHLRPGENPPAWGATSDAQLPVQVRDDDLLQGLVPEIIAGSLHPENTGTLENLTNGRFGVEPLSLLLADYENPSIHLRYTFPQPVDIREVRSFASHPRDYGSRAWQNIDIRVNGRFAVDELRTGPFGQDSPHPRGGVSVLRWMPTDGTEFVATGVHTLDIIYYPVSTNFDHTFLDPWKPATNPTATIQDSLRDFDGRDPAFAASIIKEIDVIGRITPDHEREAGN